MSSDCGALGQARVKARRVSDNIGFMIKSAGNNIIVQLASGVNCLSEAPNFHGLRLAKHLTKKQARPKGKEAQDSPQPQGRYHRLFFCYIFHDYFYPCGEV